MNNAALHIFYKFFIRLFFIKYNVLHQMFDIFFF